MAKVELLKIIISTQLPALFPVSLLFFLHFYSLSLSLSSRALPVALLSFCSHPLSLWLSARNWFARMSIPI